MLANVMLFNKAAEYWKEAIIVGRQDLSVRSLTARLAQDGLLLAWLNEQRFLWTVSQVLSR